MERKQQLNSFRAQATSASAVAQSSATVAVSMASAAAVTAAAATEVGSTSVLSLGRLFRVGDTRGAPLIRRRFSSLSTWSLLSVVKRYKPVCNADGIWPRIWVQQTITIDHLSVNKISSYSCNQGGS